MKWIVALLCAATGGAVGYAGSALYAIGMCGETGPLAGRGGFFLYLASLPGQFFGIPLLTLGLDFVVASMIGGALCWAAMALAVSGLVGIRRSKTKPL